MPMHRRGRTFDLRQLAVSSVTTNRAVGMAVLVVGLAIATAASGQPTWTPIGPNGSSSVIFATAPTTPTTVYAATTNRVGHNGGGLFKSLDGGATWTALSNDGLPAGLTTINTLAIDPSTPTTLYIGVIVWRLSQDSLARSSGVYKSTDGGAHWVNAGLPDDVVYTVVVDPTTPSTIYATEYFVVFKSTDGAATWTQLPYPPFRRATSLVVDSTTPATVYAGSPLSGVFKSTDGGASWTEANNGFGPYTPVIRALVADPTTRDTLYAAVEGEGDAVFKTTNGGGVWTAVNPSPDVGDALALAIAPTTPATLYAGTPGGLFKTSDGGDHWTTVGPGLPAVSIDALAIDPATPTQVYADAAYTGVFVTADGGDTWMPATAGLTNTYVEAMAIDPTTPATLYVGASSLGVFKSTDAGVTWTTVNTGLPITPTRPAGPEGAIIRALLNQLAFGC